MDKEDKRRYFVVGSIYLEVVTPLFQQKLEQKYQGLNLCLKDFLDDKAVIHNLFHLRHRHTRCCTDKAKCTNHEALPLNHHQWKQLYAKNAGPCKYNCFCNYKAKSVKPEDLDVSLCGLILYNCCNLKELDREVIHFLRRNKNDYLTHNTTCGITKDEYGPLMDELKTNILQLDQTKEDELIRIQKRPLDEALCNKYMTTLLNITEILEKIDTKIDLSTNRILDTVNIYNAGLSNKIHDTVHMNMSGLTATIKEFMQKFSQNCRDKLDKQGIKDQPKKTKCLRHHFLTPHHLIGLPLEDYMIKYADIVMMDDGRVVMCSPNKRRLLTCNTDGSQVEIIPIEGVPRCITAVNISTIAVTLWCSECIEMYDVKNGRKLKSILVPGMWYGSGITTINDKLVVGGHGNNRLLIINHQRGKIEQTIRTDCQPRRIYGCGDRVFYCDSYEYHFTNKNKLYCYSYTDDRQHTLKLPSPPEMMTTRQDGSLYVVCKDESVHHVSSDGFEIIYNCNSYTSKKKFPSMIYNSQ